jgi:hypothetical protein
MMKPDRIVFSKNMNCKFSLKLILYYFDKIEKVEIHNLIKGKNLKILKF